VGYVVDYFKAPCNVGGIDLHFFETSVNFGPISQRESAFQPSKPTPSPQDRVVDQFGVQAFAWTCNQHPDKSG
jgi:hypothetical protein